MDGYEYILHVYKKVWGCDIEMEEIWVLWKVGRFTT